MLKKLAHFIARDPWIYEKLQKLAGSNIIRQHLLYQIHSMESKTMFILDLAGGTGFWRDIWSHSSYYICLDNDFIKLQAYRNKRTKGMGLYADALNVPLKDGSIDAISCISTSHHLTKDCFNQLLYESVRVLKDSGIFLFMDPLWEPDNIASRFLWRYDRGSNPYTSGYLRDAILEYFNIIFVEEFSVYHKYLLVKAVQYNPKKASGL